MQQPLPSPAPLRSAGSGERRRFLNLAFAAADLLIELDAGLTIRFAAGACEALTGLTDRALVGRRIDALFGPALAARLSESAPEAEGGRIGLGSLALTSASGESVRGTLHLFTDPEAGGHLYLAFTRQAGSARASAQDSFLDAVERRLARARSDGQPVQVTLIELALPDTVREPAEIVSHFAGALGTDGHFQRIGRGKYGVFAATAMDADALAAGIAREAEKALGVRPGVTSSAFDLAEDGLTPSETMRALAYAVNRFARGDGETLAGRTLGETLQSAVEDTLGRINSLRSTLTNRAVSLRFQPIVSLNSRQILHFEALARIADGDSAAPVIAFAEQLGMSEDFDMLVCRMAIDLMQAARMRGQPVSLAVNLSAPAVSSEIFVRVLREMTQALGEARSDLLFEITETARIDNLEKVAGVVRALQGDGHHMCLDDFGVGEAGLTYLRALPVNFVKIDGSFAQNILACQRDQHLVQASAALAHRLGALTIAEMVEDEHTAQKLAELGIDLAQGYFFGRPQESIQAARALEMRILRREDCGR
ncbi:MAG: EAL domain-containing protein [Alphaproteobacteria bacterium]|nr:EAL domain-containing protein [Alphaproteobacteria bacterium]